MKPGPPLKMFDMVRTKNIVKSLASGERLVSLCAKLHTSPVIVKRSIIYEYGEEKYQELMNSHLTHRYKKGYVPHNSGDSTFGAWLHKYSMKKGDISPRLKRVGTIVTWKRLIPVVGGGRPKVFNIKWIKVARNKWETLVRYTWILHYGFIPKGKCVVQLDRDHNNFDPDNLALLTHGQFFNYLDARFPEYKRERLKNLSISLRGVHNKISGNLIRHFWECVSCSYEANKKFGKCPKCNCMTCEEIMVKARA